MTYSNIARILSILPILCFCALLVKAHNEVVAQEGVLQRLRYAPAKTPGLPPTAGQEDLDRALSLYHIHVPPNTYHPTYNPELRDRGLTSIDGLATLTGGNYQVTIGPAAFASWALLGSTLAHEIEGHCHQKIGLVALLGKTDDAEREAYQLELNDAARFGLSVEEISTISDTKLFYYPSPVDESRAGRFYSLFLSAKSSSSN